MEWVIWWEDWLVFTLDFIKPDNLRLYSKSSLHHGVSATDAIQQDCSELTIE